MRWQGRRESDNVEDRRSSGGGGPSMGGPGFRLPSGKGGIILLVVVLVAGYYGVDLTGLMTGETGQQQQYSQRSISPNEDEAAKFTSVILATTEDTWGQQFEKMGRTLSAAKTGDVPGRNPHWLRHRAVRYGAVLLPGGQHRLYRSLLL